MKKGLVFVVERSSRSSAAEVVFCKLLYGSLLESVSELKVAQKQQFLGALIYEKVCGDAEQVAKMLSGLTRRLEEPIK